MLILRYVNAARWTTTIFLLIFSLVFIFQVQSFPQGNTSRISGVITDENGNPLLGATVLIKETRSGTTSDNNGEYKLPVQPGKYILEVTYIGFEKQIRNIEVKKDQHLSASFRLVSTSFKIGEITVSPPDEFLPGSSETKTSVSSSEIEHIQAASLSDVMKLLPGTETTNPSLQSAERAVIRGGNALGTQIILDGVPVTNNANMQSTGTGQGIDLRSIPAENIKEVEIIRGIPSVKYGDLTDGAVIVRTKASADPYRLKMKYNPQLYEANLSGGYRLGAWIANANLNAASSQRDIRIVGDGYTRIAGQLSFLRQTDNFEINNIFYATRAFDERKEQPGYALKQAGYNRDLNVKYTGNLGYEYSAFGGIKSTISLSYTKQDSYNQELLSRDNIVISDRITEGTSEGRIMFGSYLGKKWIKGDVWNIYTDLSVSDKFFTGNFLHSITGGLNWRDDLNKGAGIVFDPLFPPSLIVPVPRLRSYDELPDYQQVSLYAEDKITGNLFRPFTLTMGLRYESYRPEGLSLKGKNGSFLNPRLTLSYSLFDDTQIRFGYGQTSKAAPMSMLFPGEVYYDVVDTVSVKDPLDPQQNFSLVSTYITKPDNTDIKGYTQQKYEVSIDQQVTFGGISITGYYNSSENMFETRSIPTVYYKKSFPEWPDLGNSTIKDTLFDYLPQYFNNGWQKSSGIEMAVSTKRIPVINSILRIDAAYNYSESGSKSDYYFSLKRFAKQLNAEVVPMYNDYDSFEKSLLINYRFEIQARSLGMWLTLHIQQKPIDVYGRRGYGDTLAIGYYNASGNLVMIPEDERASEKYSQLRRTVRDFELFDEDRPNRWLLNLKLSKSLWEGGVISFFVNNLFNNHPLYRIKRRAANSPQYERLNPDIYYGLEFSTSIGDR